MEETRERVAWGVEPYREEASCRMLFLRAAQVKHFTLERLRLLVMDFAAKWYQLTNSKRQPDYRYLAGLDHKNLCTAE